MNIFSSGSIWDIEKNGFCSVKNYDLKKWSYFSVKQHFRFYEFF